MISAEKSLAEKQPLEPGRAELEDSPMQMQGGYATMPVNQIANLGGLGGGIS